jgi:ABC-type branched-subunit amino acid transport system ATPase component
VPVGFEEATRYIPQFGPPGLVDDLQWVAIGLLILVFLWFRPQGILPERRRRIGASAPSKPIEMPNEDVVTLASSLRAPGLAEATGQDGSAVRVTGRPITRSAPSSVAPGTADEGMVLRAVDVTRDFGGVHAVAGVSIEVRRGTLTGLIGPNGAGKSTLLAMLAGTLPVTSGQVIYAGADVTSLPVYRRARLGLVRTFQLASEFKRLTVMENLLSAVPLNRGDSLVGALRGRRYWRADEEAAIARAPDRRVRCRPNGSGKSTLMKALTGVVRLSSGRVFVGDRDVGGLAPEEIARAGVQLDGEPRPGNDLGLRRCTGTATRAWRSTARPAGLGTRSPCRSPEDAELIRFGPTLTGAGRRPMRSSGWLAQGGLRVS